METGASAKQVIELQKTLFDNTYKVMSSAQEQAEKVTSFFLKQSPMISKEDKSKFDKAMDIYKDMRDGAKKNVDDGFIKLEKLFDTKASESN